MKHFSLQAILTSLLLCFCGCPGVTADNVQAGEQVDITPFGRLCSWTGTTPMDIERHPAKSILHDSGKTIWLPGKATADEKPHIGVEWDFSQDVAGAEIEFLTPQAESSGGENALQYWHDSWPPQDRGGWTRLDDPYNGKWIRPNAEFRREENRWIYRFLPLSKDELPQSGDVNVSYRRTYKVRVVLPDSENPGITALRVFSRHRWKQADLKIETGAGQRVNALKLVSASAFCGHILSPLEAIRPDDGTAYAVSILYSDGPDDSPDRTIVTVRWGEKDTEGVSFLPALAIREGIFVPEFGLWITEKGGERFQDTKFAKASGEPRTIWERVASEQEQGYWRARGETPPPKDTAHRPHGRYVPLGCEGNRQEFGILYNGNILCQRTALKSPGREDSRMLWPSDEILYKLGTGDTPDFREREEAAKQQLMHGYLPVVNTEWENGDIVFRESAIVSLLAPENADPASLRGDETSVLLLSLSMVNSSDKPASARVWFTTTPAETLEVKDGLALAIAGTGKAKRYPEGRLRCLIDTRGKGKLSPASVTPDASSEKDAVAFDVTLEPKGQHQIFFKVPFLSSLSEEEMSRLKSMEFNRELRGIVRYWQTRIDRGARIRVPNRLFNDFIQAQFWHILITADKDVDTGLTMLPAATFGYNVCANEACHQIRSLDVRGYSNLAEEYLEPFVRLQGTRGLHGRFRSREGVFHGLLVKEGVDYQRFNYNLDHGFVLWMLCEHFRLTGDREWLRRVSPNIVKGCDFIIRERMATKLTDADGQKVWQYGLLPPGHLEDNPEFLHWYAVNAYAYRGMRDAAEVLSEISCPDADRIRKEASEYLTDLQRATRKSMLLSPVVNQGNGTYIPFQPTRCFLRGRDLGWIRDSLYGPIHLIACGLYPWNSREATWILQDAENNVFVSRERGLGIDTDKWWFSHGGMTLQPNLVPTPIVYVHRDEPERAVRAFYNTFAASIYEEGRAFCEWLPAKFGRGGGPFYKTPDESAFIVWLRYLLAVEDGDRLTLCPAAPREWFANGEEISVEKLPTYFGEVTFRVASTSEEGEIRAHVVPPTRKPPKELRLRIRHPQKKPIQAVQVNGETYSRFDAAGEYVSLPSSDKGIDVVVKY